MTREVSGWSGEMSQLGKIKTVGWIFQGRDQPTLKATAWQAAPAPFTFDGWED